MIFVLKWGRWGWAQVLLECSGLLWWKGIAVFGGVGIF